MIVCDLISHDIGKTCVSHHRLSLQRVFHRHHRRQLLIEGLDPSKGLLFLVQQTRLQLLPLRLFAEQLATKSGTLHFASTLNIIIYFI